MIFGKKIKELREERGLVQRQLSVALEIDTPMYSKIERGERKAKRSQIPIMAQMFEVDVKELLTIGFGFVVRTGPNFFIKRTLSAPAQISNVSFHKACEIVFSKFLSKLFATSGNNTYLCTCSLNNAEAHIGGGCGMRTYIYEKRYLALCA